MVNNNREFCRAALEAGHNVLERRVHKATGNFAALTNDVERRSFRWFADVSEGKAVE